MEQQTLRKIIFFLTEKYYDRITSRTEEIKKAALSGASDSIQIVISSCSEGKHIYPVIASCFNDRKQTLLVTDSSLLINLFVEQGFFTVALYHECNRQENFSATPYAVEDVFSLTYDSYLKAYQRLAGLPWDILKTPHLSLRESTISDVDAFYRIYQEPSITRYMENLFSDRDEECAYMEEYIKNIYGFYGFGLWTVLHTASGKIIGRAGLSVREGYELPELGFVTDVSFQRQGYTFEICRAILTYAFEELDFPQVQAFCHPDNTASRCLLQKLGFTCKENVSIDGRSYKRYHKHRRENSLPHTKTHDTL